MQGWVWLIMGGAVLVLAGVGWFTRSHPREVPTEHQARPSQPPGQLQEGAARWPQGPGMR